MPSVLAAGRFTSLGVTFVRPGRDRRVVRWVLCDETRPAGKERASRASGRSRPAEPARPEPGVGRPGLAGPGRAGARGLVVGSGPWPAGGLPGPVREAVPQGR